MPANADTVNVSVVIAAYNAERHLQQTLDSILMQSYDDLEIIVVDDGSTDGTADIAAAAGDRVILIRQDNSGGPSRPRNVGVDRARGELVAFFDADDVMLPGKLAASAAVFADHREVDLLFTDFRTIDEAGQTTAPSFLAGYRSFRRALQPTADPRCFTLQGDELVRELYLGNFVGTSSVVARRTVVREAGGFAEDLRNSEDIDLWLRLARRGCVFALLEQPLHCYRKRHDSISRAGSVTVENIIRRVERNLPGVPDATTRRAVLANLHNLLISYGYALRCEGRFRQSVAAYRRAARMRPSGRAISGLLRSQLLAWFGRRGRPS